MLSPATAQQGPAPRAWALTVGAAPLFGPVFSGSDDYALSVFPDLRVNYKDRFFASIPDGVGYNVVNTRRVQAGPLVQIRFGRDEESGGSPFLVAGDSDGLQGLGDLSAAGEAGLFFQWNVGRVLARAELRQGFGAHEGWVADLSTSFSTGDRWPLLGPVIWSVGPRLTAGGSDFIDPYFGIDARQSGDSGLPQFSADGGLVSAGVVGTIVRPVNRRLAYTLFCGYDRFLGDVKDSPLITERGTADQFFVGLGVGYRFFWGDG